MKKKILFVSTVGNAFEMFDFYLYAAFFSLMASRFFPTEDKVLSIFMSVSGFGLGLVMRPVGALIFGYIGDIFGRKITLSLTLFLIGFPTFLIGILPSYEEIGLIAPLIIISGRLCQGICYGGEFNGAFIFALEHVAKNPGRVSGIIIGSCVVGIFAATLLSELTQLPGMPGWAWRIPFIIGGGIVLIGYFARKNLTESPEFLKAFSKSQVPILKIIQTRKAACFLCFSIGALIGGLFYTDFGFLNIYLARYYHMPLNEAMKINFFSIIACIIGCPLFGIVYDKVRQDLFLRIMSYTLFFGMIPVFWLISSPSFLLLILGEIILGICTASISAVGFAIMQTLFPVKERYSGISFFYSVGIAFCGGIAPVLFMDAIEIHKESLFFPAYFLMCLVALFYGSLKLYVLNQELQENPQMDILLEESEEVLLSSGDSQRGVERIF